MSSWLPSISNISNKIYSQFPQNAHTIKASELETQIQQLTGGLSDKSSDIFKERIIDTKKTFAEKAGEKETCLTTLAQLNGYFFQDPRSALKKAWEIAVRCVKTALNENLTEHKELDVFADKLEKQPQTPEVETASRSIIGYKMLEKSRDKAQSRLKEILAVEKADDASRSLDALKKRQRELCGNYYGDRNGLLDKAWREYKDALNDPHLASSAQLFLNAYNLLETERKNNEVLLKRLNSITPEVANHTIETLTMQSIQTQIDQLKEDKEKELALSGIDWKKTALLATSLTLGTVAVGSQL